MCLFKFIYYCIISKLHLKSYILKMGGLSIINLKDFLAVILKKNKKIKKS